MGSERVWLAPEMRADFLKSCGQQSRSVEKEEKTDGSGWKGKLKSGGGHRVCALGGEAMAAELGSDQHDATESFLLPASAATVSTSPLPHPSCLCLLCFRNFI